MLKLNTNLLKSYRLQNQLTYGEAAQKVGAAAPQWWQWENGVVFPMHYLDKLAQLIGVSQGLLIVEDRK